MTQQLLQRDSQPSALGSVRGADSAYPRTGRDHSSSSHGHAPHAGEVAGSIDASIAGSTSWAARFVRNLAPQDWYIGTYFPIILLALAFGSGPDRPSCMRLVLIDWMLFATGLALTRGGVLRPGSFLNSFLYRMTVFLGVFLSYFQLRHILPAVSERAVDADILAFDLKVFHVEPSLAWDRFVNPTTTEWFAFFYFGYFALMALHIFPMMLVAKDVKRLSHFAMGIFIVFCTGHLVYMLVPGYGPYRHLAGQFQHELTGGTFWGWVQATVQAGGAQKDIFPSLHTAAPTFSALFAFRHRKAAPFKYTWPVVAFCASQIIGATMFLRWHYLIDIFAGITLATIAVVLGEKLVVWDARRREAWNARAPGSVEPNFYLLDWKGLFGQGARFGQEER
jgi:hypothetical protein